MGREPFLQPRVLRAPSSLALNPSREGTPTASLGSLGQGLTPLIVKNLLLISSLNLLCFSLKPSPFVLSLQAFVRRPWGSWVRWDPLSPQGAACPHHVLGLQGVASQLGWSWTHCPSGMQLVPSRSWGWHPTHHPARVLSVPSQVPGQVREGWLTPSRMLLLVHSSGPTESREEPSLQCSLLAWQQALQDSWWALGVKASLPLSLLLRPSTRI